MFVKKNQTAMRKIILALVVTTFANLAQAQGNLLSQKVSALSFYQLPYNYSELEPVIDALTVEIHYSRHHRSYFQNFVKIAEELKISDLTFNEMFGKVSSYPAGIRNNGGGYFNHVLYWEILKPGNRKNISKSLSDAIIRDFGSVDNMINQVNDASLKRFGSGWAWVVVGNSGKLMVCSTPNQDNPLMDVSDVKGVPIVGVDVWEHAYYLKYQNKRAEYVKNFWELVNWEVVSALYEEAILQK